MLIIIVRDCQPLAPSEAMTRALRFSLNFLRAPQPIPTVDPEHREGQENDELDRDKLDAFYRIQTDARNIDRDPQNPGFEDPPREQYRCEYARDRDEGIDVRICRRVIEDLRQYQVDPCDKSSDDESHYRDERRDKQPVSISQCPDRAVVVRCPALPGEPTIDTHPAKIELQKHIRVEMYLVKDDKKKYRVRDPRWPCEDVCSGRQKDRDQAQSCADKFDIAYGRSEDREESLFDIKERRQAGNIRHV